MSDLDKKITLVAEILKLSIEITNNSDADVFCDYSGHVNGLTVRVLLNGWTPDYTEPDYYKSIYLERTTVNELEEVINYLKGELK